MLIGWRLMGGGSGETETIIPSVGTLGKNPIEFGTLFYNTHGRYPIAGEKVAFRLPPGNYPGIPFTNKPFLGKTPTWELGTGWGTFPTQMKLIIEGNQYSSGGCGLRAEPNVTWRSHTKYFCDGGNVMDFTGTESFINASTPLLLEGSGNLYSGGGGGESVHAVTPTVQNTTEGRSGAGFPYITVPAALTAQTITFGDNTLTYSIKAVGDTGSPISAGAGYGTITPGAGGGFGKMGSSGTTSGAYGPGVDIGTGGERGEAGVVFYYANNSDTRFSSAASIFAAINFDNYTGSINNIPASSWRNNLTVMRNASMFGYIDHLSAFKHFFQGISLATVVPAGTT